jgi:hypothetical protein
VIAEPLLSLDARCGGFAVAVEDEGEPNYYRRRAAQERQSAEAAEIDAVKHIHMQLAQMCEARAMALGKALIDKQGKG